VRPSRVQPSLEANVAADDNVAAEDGARVRLLVDRVRNDTSGHGELDRRSVDDADDVAGAGGLQEAEEGPVAAILSVELDDLLVVVRALEQLDPGVERTAIRLQIDLSAVNRRVERVGAEGTALDGRGGGSAVGRRKSTLSATTLAAMGNSIWPMLRMATVLGPRGVSITALNGRSWPFST